MSVHGQAAIRPRVGMVFNHWSKSQQRWEPTRLSALSMDGEVFQVTRLSTGKSAQLDRAVVERLLLQPGAFRAPAQQQHAVQQQAVAQQQPVNPFARYAVSNSYAGYPGSSQLPYSAPTLGAKPSSTVEMTEAPGADSSRELEIAMLRRAYQEAQLRSQQTEAALRDQQRQTAAAQAEQQKLVAYYESRPSFSSVPAPGPAAPVSSASGEGAAAAAGARDLPSRKRTRHASPRGDAEDVVPRERAGTTEATASLMMPPPPPPPATALLRHKTSEQGRRLMKDALERASKKQFPSTWRVMADSESWALVDVKPDTPDGRFVRRLLARSVPLDVKGGFRIRSLKRVQHRDRWCAYAARRQVSKMEPLIGAESMLFGSPFRLGEKFCFAGAGQARDPILLASGEATLPVLSKVESPVPGLAGICVSPSARYVLNYHAFERARAVETVSADGIEVTSTTSYSNTIALFHCALGNAVELRPVAQGGKMKSSSRVSFWPHPASTVVAKAPDGTGSTVCLVKDSSRLYCGWLIELIEA